MTKDEALDLALEAAYLAGFNASGEGYNGEYPFRDHGAPPEQDAGWIKNRDNELTAIKQARSAPVQEHQINQLEKFKNHVLANADALGVVLDAPAAPVQEDWGPGPHGCHSLTAAPVQEPFGYFRYDMRLDAWVQSRDSNRGIAFYTTPPAGEKK